MELLKVDTLEQAREKMLQHVGKDYLRICELTLGESLGMVLAEDVLCTRNIPNFRRSTVDGYALCAKDTMGADENLPVFLRVLEEVQIGREAQSEIIPGSCAYVPTGGMIPSGADSCVMVEYCEVFDENNVAVYQSVPPGKFMVSVGEDYKQGSILLRKGSKIRPQEIAVMAANGMEKVKVFAPLRVRILSTGDELVQPGQNLCKGQIFDINTYALSAMARKHGFEVVGEESLPDEEDLLRAGIAQALQDSDILLISGGSSKGKKDMTARLLHELSKPGVFIHGLAIKPGKPTVLGFDKDTKTLLVGLPGHPAAAMAVFEMLPAWLKDYLQKAPPALTIPAVLKGNVPGTPGRQFLLFVRLLKGESFYEAEPIFGNSGLISSISAADAYALLDLNREGLKSGEILWVHPF